jgi:hypothetical protein
LDLISARTAFEAGLKRYFTGKPCKHGHVAERMVSNGCCVECLNGRRRRDQAKIYAGVKAWKHAHSERTRDQRRQYATRHPEALRAKAARYRAGHIEQVRAADAERQRIRRSADPEAARRRYLAWREKREGKLAATAGRPRPDSCELCGGAEGGIVFDHCHESGLFRGWICDRCNKTLGLLRDDAGLLLRMATYLMENRNGETYREGTEIPPHQQVRGA